MIQGVLIATAVVGVAVTALLGTILVPLLRRLKYGQTINDIGPVWHKKKEGVPTMGGLMFIIGIIAGICTGYFTLIYYMPELLGPIYTLENARLLLGLLMALCYSCIGFIDDWIKVSRKRNLGLTSRQKLVFQILIAAIYLVGLYLHGDVRTMLYIPFYGYLELGYFYYLFAVVLIVGAVNAANLTDGIDGLCGSVSFIYCVVFVMISGILGQVTMSILSIAGAAGCIGFLLWNFYPAKVIMGDTGSMFLGGLTVALCFGTGLPALYFLVGIIYLCDTFSVILQVLSVKLFKRRIFKMTPIHHSFELSGYSEIKIVCLFSAVTIFFGAIAVAIVAQL